MSVMFSDRNGEDIVMKHWYDPASARVSGTNIMIGSDAVLAVVNAPPSS